MSEDTNNRVWMDISAETVRIYHLYTGDQIRIENPQRVGIKRTQLADGTYEDSHVVWDANGFGCYIKDFAAIEWAGYDATDETFGARLNTALTSGDTEA